MKHYDLCDMNYTAYPFIDVLYSLCQVYFTMEADEKSAHEEIRNISIGCIVYGIVL